MSVKAHVAYQDHTQTTVWHTWQKVPIWKTQEAEKDI